MQYKPVERGEPLDEGWLEYHFFANAGGRVGVFIPASWGDKQAALKVMQAGLAGLVMPEGTYRIVTGDPEDMLRIINTTNCMLLGPPFGDGLQFQAIIEFSDTVAQARETWGELIASRMRWAQ